MNLDIVMDKFQNYCTPKKNITYERHKFFTCIQKPGESIDQYLTILRTKSKSCDFGDLDDSLIRGRIICGIPNNALRERLLREEDLTLSKAVQMCRAAETTRSQVKELQSDDVVSVHAVHAAQQQKHGRTKQIKGQSEVTSQQQNKPKYNCGRCGRKHGPGECPATGKECAKCGLPIHNCLLGPVDHEVIKTKRYQKQKQKMYFDKKSKALPKLETGDRVRVEREGKWQTKGQVQEQVAPRSFLVKTDEGSLLRRNRKDLRKVKLEEHSGSVSVDDYMREQEFPEATTSEEIANPDSSQIELRRSSRQVKPPERLIESM
ncbi:hypothetical protein HOLleu_02204 [Holothuria leucospilota]|uniref:Retrotransposon gag domain-containing protein n=1 Tax=Holothuria leucospilota TaxID=206669 RepID=A0A9Q1CRA9_HOLLE|nr:hypothetical protein HOLleu_02204 [Holothuria leucospilota]